VIMVLLAGTLFYRQAEGWSILDSLYFSVITLTTVGYGDLVPSTAVSKVFTIIYIFIGLGIILAFVNTVAERAIERRRTKDRRKDAAESTPEDATKTGSWERE
jgi:voltage-gated potassium channel